MDQILHILTGSSNINVRITDFLINFFDKEKHKIVLLGNNNKLDKSRITFINSKKRGFDLIRFMKNSDKIIIHGLFSPYLVLLLFGQPWILKKTYWYIWGGDLYYYKFKEKSVKSNFYEFVRKKVIKNLGNIITPLKGDYELAKKWYKTNAKYHEAFYINPLINGYFDNLFNSINERKDININNNKIIIQIGNSADPRNNHLELLNKLSKFKNNDIEIIAPLSYGNQEYANEVIKQGKYIYNNKFKPLTKFLSLEEYYKILNSVDVGLFNHDRQQALGNIYSLLYLGKKVYIKNNITTWDFLKSKGLSIYNIYDLDNLDLEELINMERSLKEKNKKILKKEFSIEKGIELWNKIFNS